MSAADQTHLDDARLIAARTGGLAFRRGEHTHLASCEACARRDREWCAALAASRAAAEADADAPFPASRLARQREAILRRLERLEPARVLAFPTIPGIGSERPRRNRSRWIAAAAAAGLFVGAFTGQYMGLGPRRLPPPAGASTVVQPVHPITARHPVTVLSDDDFLLEVDSAIGRPRVAELRTIDDLTPSLRDAAIRIR